MLHFRYMDRMKSLAEKQFLRQTLNESGAQQVKQHKAAIDKFLVRRTGKTEDSVNYSVQQIGASSAMLVVEHTAQQRFLDMKARFRGQSKKRGKISYPIHNRIVWRNFYITTRILRSGMVQSLTDIIKNTSING